jgi:DNA-binding CsgD family transcriptional regulator
MSSIGISPKIEANVSRVGKPKLSVREIEVLLAWLRSDSKSEVAETLGLRVCTVNTHITRVRTKYSDVGRPAPTKAALFARAVQDGYTTLDEW